MSMTQCSVEGCVRGDYLLRISPKGGVFIGACEEHYLDQMELGFCPGKGDGQHCRHWWDGLDPCCRCRFGGGDPGDALIDAAAFTPPQGDTNE